MEIRFYDNEYKNWDKDMNIHREIGFLHVDDEIPNVHIQHVNLEKVKTQKDKNRVLNLAYLRHFAGQNNSYAQTLLRVVENPNSDVKEVAKILEKYHPSNGLDIHYTNLEYWGSSDTKDKVLLLDWDRTVTTVEGFYVPALDDATVLFDDVLEFVMGGRERLDKYIHLFHNLHVQNKLPIFIVTHNPNASKRSKHRQIYLRMLRHLLGTITIALDEDSMIICTTDHMYKKHLAVCATEIKEYLMICKEIADGILPSHSDNKMSDDVAEPTIIVPTTVETATKKRKVDKPEPTSPVEKTTIKTATKKRKVDTSEPSSPVEKPDVKTATRKRRHSGGRYTHSKKIHKISRKTRKYVIKKKI